MRRYRIICLLLAIILLFHLPPVATGSAEVFFTMINGNAPEQLQPHTMPVQINGIMHVPLSTLERLGLVFSFVPDDEFSIRLTRSADVYVEFNLYDQTNVTSQGDSLALTPINRHGTLFFPISTGPAIPGPLVSFFGANYQFIHMEPAPVVRLYHDLGGISHEALLLEGEQLFGLAERLNTFIGNPSGGGGGGTTVIVPSPSPPPPPPAEDEELEPVDLDSLPVHQVYLSFVGLTEETASLLDQLARARIPAGFFVTAADVEAFPDLVRRIHGEGHQLGIYLVADAAGEFTAASRALFDSARLRTVLVAAQTDAVAQSADTLGLIVYETPVLREFDGTNGATRLSGDLLVYSGDVSAYALAALTDLLRSNAYRAVRIVDSIFAL